MAIFFTADLHLGHANIIKYCNRPFESVDAMDAALMSNWNQVVGPADTVYILGDVCFRNAETAVEKVKALNGKKILISGNHDKELLKNSDFVNLFQIVSPLMEIKIQNPKTKSAHDVVLCHYPMLSWNKKHRGSWHLHGHSHGAIQAMAGEARMDVGIDATAGYRPVSAADVISFITMMVGGPNDTKTD